MTIEHLLKSKKPEIRFLNDMREVLYDKEWLRKAKNFEVYYMYRGLKKKAGLRYDITIIPPRMLGKEFTKTKGHYHIDDFPELYIVLSGQAIYLMQKVKGETIEDVYGVRAKKGEAVIIPQGYGHVTINPSDKSLKMANWIKDEGKSDYQPIEKMQGTCYFYTKSGWQKNKNYKKVPPLRFEKPLESIPENLNFLKE